MATARQPLQPTTRELPLLDHLEELRWRIIYSCVAWVVGAVVAYNFRGLLMTLARHPLDAYVNSGHPVVIASLSVTEPIVVVVQLATFGGLALALPFIAYQLWAFVAPALTRTERLWAAPFVVGLGGSFALGIAFAYMVILPNAIPFMLGFLPGVTNLLSVGRYFSDVTMYLGIFGVVFELPVTLFLLAKIGLVTATQLRRWRKAAILTITAVSAVITPTPDPVNLALMAVPLVLLYEVGIVLAGFARRESKNV